MGKLDKAVKKETLYIAIWVIILSVLMQSVFLAIGKWDYTVLLGNLLSGSFVTLNFLLMGIGVQKALSKNDEKVARNTIKLSQTMRTFMLFIVAAIGAILDCFNIWAVVIPFVFPRIAFLISGFTKRN
ncbi:MAG: hypothetical protein II998_01410 [Clostridia bacterium]|nr:hypothetical protein [Clostridia bacterium]